MNKEDMKKEFRDNFMNELYKEIDGRPSVFKNLSDKIIEIK